MSCSFKLSCWAICTWYIHFFFKLPAGWRADYKSIGDVTSIVSESAMKHSITRWVTFPKVVVSLIEQHENLKEYFLNFLSKTTGFRDVKKTPRLKNFERRRCGMVPFTLQMFFKKILNNVPITIHIMYRNWKPPVEHYEQIYQIKIFV